MPTTKAKPFQFNQEQSDHVREVADRNRSKLRSELQALWNSIEEGASGLVVVDTDRLEAMQEILQSIAGTLGIALQEYSGGLQKEWDHANAEPDDSAEEETGNVNEED